MGLAQTARDRQRATIGGRANPFQNDDPLGKAFADWAETTGQQALTGSVKAVGDWWERSSADQEGVSDDLLRLVAGGVKNTTKAWKAASAEQEGITDDILRGVGWTAGKGMQVLDAGSYYGGQIGGKLASAVGVDARIGGAAGNIIGDVALGFGVAKAGKAAKLGEMVKKGAKAYSYSDLPGGPALLKYRASRFMPQSRTIVDQVPTVRYGADPSLRGQIVMSMDDVTTTGWQHNVRVLQDAGYGSDSIVDAIYKPYQDTLDKSFKYISRESIAKNQDGWLDVLMVLFLM